MTSDIIQFPVTVQGVRTRVLEAGQGERSLLFLHGLGARADRWRRNLGVAGALGYRCIAIDLPGHGMADKGADIPATVQEMATYVAEVAQVLELGDSVLVGTSLGGHILGRVALDQKIPTRGLMLIGTLGLFSLDAAVASAIRASIVETSLEAIQRKLAFVMKLHDGITPAFIREEFLVNNSDGARASFERLGHYLVTGHAGDVIGPDLAELGRRMPLEIVWGEADEAVPVRIGHDAQRLLGLPAPLLLPGAGHAPYWERADLFNPMLAAFAQRAFGSV